jgi:hypothetical protein
MLFHSEVSNHIPIAPIDQLYVTCVKSIFDSNIILNYRLFLKFKFIGRDNFNHLGLIWFTD